MKTIIKMINAGTPFLPTALAVLLLLLPTTAFCGDWRVAPIRLEFGRNAKSGAITVFNEGTEKLTVQMKAMEWSQDADGKDVYTEANDLVFFPKIMVLDKKEEKIIRAGIKVPASAREKTYRLFIEEIPEPRKKDGANIAVAIRFGVPVFAKPLKEEPRGEIESISMKNGIVSTTVKNTGNVHFRIASVTVTGKDAKGNPVFSSNLDGWYLLSGIARTHTSEISREKCRDAAKIEVEVKSDSVTLNGKADIDGSMCHP